MSSAAQPLPYPTAGPGDYGNGGRRPSTTPNGGGERAFAHIKDLQEKSMEGFSTISSVPRLLDAAEAGVRQADTMERHSRPDLAYVEFLRAYEIVINVIPKHRDSVDFSHDQHGDRKLKLVRQKLSGMDARYMGIKEMIKSNNARHGAIPRSEQHRSRADNAPERRLNGSGNVFESPNAVSSPRKVKPPPSPKPDSLHGRALSNTNGAKAPPATDINARFAQLRMSSTSKNQASSPSSIHSSPISMPSNSDFTGRTSLDSLHSISSLSGRPSGPRVMPGVSTSGPGFNMPQEPKATYSPARNMQTTGNIAPPRHSARSLESSRRTYSGGTPSSASSTAPNGLAQSGEYFPNTSAGPVGQRNRRKSSVSMPAETRMGAERLYDYIRHFNVLLIDFRNREEFDHGHIYSQNVICIEPFSIRHGMSADEILESMVSSPDNEQDMFYNRDKYDLVVYYDRNTQSETYLDRPVNRDEERLKYLHEALDVFNEEKPLQHPPILLIGGIEAWTDLLGGQALKSSMTKDRAKQGRPIQRRPLATANEGRNSELRVPKRRVREYNPLNDEEEKYFLERARAESVALPPSSEFTQRSDGGGDTGDEDEESTGAIRQFLERFPDANNIDRHAFGGVMPSRAPPPPPAKIPMYPSAPSPSTVPSEPARPAPAVPRMSYTGVSEPTPATPGPRSSSNAPYIPPKYLAANIRLPRTGLYNFGATCYMNSTIQALSATAPLSVFFLDDAFLAQVQRTNWKTNSKGVMVQLYSNLIRSLWKGDVQVVKPTTFRKFCGRANTTYENDHVQQDAKEFLEFLLDCLHEDLNMTWSRTPLRALNDNEEAKRERMPKTVVSKLEWGRYQHRDHSYVQNLFGGQHLSQLVCQTCHFTSSKYEFFSSLSVEIPDPRKLPGGRTPSLHDCLRSYCSEEILRSGEVWTCPRCKQPRETSKRITITRVPQTLILHFKRFDHGGVGSSGRKKMIPVDFPLENLDLSPYVLPSPNADQARAIARDYGADALKMEDCMTPPYFYDAYAVIRHHGSTLSSGHYTTVVKDRVKQKWRNFNDSRVEDWGMEEVHGSRKLQNQEAYIVFYHRKQEGQHF